MPDSFVPIAGGIRVVVNATQNGSERVNVFGVTPLGGGSPTSAQVNGAAADLVSSIQTAIGLWHNTVQFLNVTATDVSVENGYQNIDPFFPPLAGTNNNASAMPGNVAFAIKLGTGHIGRRNRGRIYMFGMAGNHIDTSDPSRVVQQYAVNCVAFINSFQTALDANGMALAILSKADGIAKIVTSVGITDLNVDSQRRRLEGRGR